MLNKPEVYYLGPNGSFGHMASKELFPDLDDGKLWTPRPTSPQPKIIDCVVGNSNSFGVVAVENTTSGVVSEDVLVIERSSRTSLRVVAELDLEVQFGVYARNDLGDMVHDFPLTATGINPKLFAHHITQEQCQNTIHFWNMRRHEKGLKDLELQTVQSNSEAARCVMENPEISFAITSRAAAGSLIKISTPVDRVKNHLVDEAWDNCVNDHAPSRTRFWAIGHDVFPLIENREGRCFKYKTSFLIFLDRTESGVLCAALSPFKDAHIPVHLVFPCTIPGRGWEYTFLFEVEGHVLEEPLATAYKKLLKMRWLFPVPPSWLGSYVNLASLSAPNEANSRTIALDRVRKELMGLAKSP
jgi:prephenate dehydratase